MASCAHVRTFRSECCWICAVLQVQRPCILSSLVMSRIILELHDQNHRAAVCAFQLPLTASTASARCALPRPLSSSVSLAFCKGAGATACQQVFIAVAHRQGKRASIPPQHARHDNTTALTMLSCLRAAARVLS
jgi:hypothetical protein